MSKTPVQVAIIGLNRMTASIGLALRQYSEKSDSKIAFTVVGQDSEKDTMVAAKHFGAVDSTMSNTQSVVRTADIVLVSLAPSLLEPVYEYFSPGLKGGAVVLDMSTAKSTVVQLAQKHFPKGNDGKPAAHLMGIQPIVSNEFLFDARSEVEAAHADLFRGGEMVISPTPTAPPEAVKLATDFASILGMRQRFISPEEYEGLSNFSERLPLMLAFSLFATMDNARGRLDLVRVINPDFGLLLHPLHNIQAADLVYELTDTPADSIRRLDEVINVLEEMKTLLAEKDAETQKTFIRDMLTAYWRWHNQREKGDWDDSPKALDVNARGRFFGNIFGRNKS